MLGVGVALFAGAGPSRADTVLNLTDSTINGNSSQTAGTLNNGYFEVGSVHPAGTGVYDPFLTIQRKGQEQGYNTLGSLQFDEKRQPEWTHDLLLSSLKVVTAPNGAASYEFTLDINESMSKALISLDALQIYLGGAGTYSSLDLTQHKFTDAGATSQLVYNMDTGTSNNTVLLNYGVISSGSGSSDLNVYINKSLFDQYAGQGLNYVYLYSHFGGYGSNFQSDAGYEEWRAVYGSNPPAPGPTPAPLPSAALAGVALMGMVPLRRGARRRAGRTLGA
jgi:hypothetical protein